MKIILNTFFISIFIIKTCAQNKHEIQFMDKYPNWGNNLRTINLGDYDDYLVQENPKEKILAFHSWGDRQLGITPPYNQFIYLFVDNRYMFLKFISIKKNGKHHIQTYISQKFKVVLDYDGEEVTNSGNGEGGIFYFYYDNKLIQKYRFWASI